MSTIKKMIYMMVFTAIFGGAFTIFALKSGFFT